MKSDHTDAKSQAPVASDTTELDLSHEGLTELPEWVGQLTQLRSLYLNDNQLTSLPEGLGQLTELRSLFLYNNQLTALPEGLVQLTGLERLSLWGNPLEALPEGLRKLTQLQNLDLSTLQLRELPEWLGQLTQLQFLYLTGNELTVLPEWLGQLTDLRDLRLGGNQLAALPKSLGQLSQLQALDLGRNLLREVPDWVGGLRQLQTLSLSHNQLTVMPESMRELTSLEQLFLHGNEALGLPPKLLGPRSDEVDRDTPAANPKEILEYYFSNLDSQPPQGDSDEQDEDTPVPPDTHAPPAAVSDSPTDQDALGYREYAQSIVEFISHRRTQLPLSIGVSAPWGSGKTSLMKMIKTELDRNRENGPSSQRLSRRCETVWINPWQYEDSAAMWAAMTRALYEYAQHDYAGGPIARLKFRLALGLEIRKNPSPSWLLIARKLGARWLASRGGQVVTILAGVVTALIALIPVSGTDSTPQAQEAISSVTDTILEALKSIPGLGAGLAAILGPFLLQAKGLRQPFSFDLRRYTSTSDNLQGPAYSADAGDDIARLIELLAPTDSDALVIFIDDLDRCSPKRVVETVEAINLMFGGAGDTNTVFILGMDTDMVAASIRVAYRDMVEELDRRQNRAATDYGFRFLAKAVQLSFGIPEPGPRALGQFVEQTISYEPDGDPSQPDRPSADILERARSTVREQPTISAARQEAVADLTAADEDEKEAVAQAYQEALQERTVQALDKGEDTDS
ncbi:MAG: hypothetical protein CL878_14735 [Dehalococcoidia bacterium]|nr:hypothetical protein [Dehalococcoidia bacterium]